MQVCIYYIIERNYPLKSFKVGGHCAPPPVLYGLIALAHPNNTEKLHRLTCKYTYIIKWNYPLKSFKVDLLMKVTFKKIEKRLYE